MRRNDHFPKSIRQAIQYIKKDAPKEQSEEIKRLINYAIDKRNSNLKAH